MLAPPLALAQQAQHPLTLWEAYQLAQERDAQIAAAEAELRAQSQSEPLAKARLMPYASAVGSASFLSQSIDYLGSAPFADSNRIYPAYGYGLRLTQPLFHKDYLEAYRQSKLVVSQAQTRFASARQDLALNVSRAYFDVLTAQEALVLAKVEKEANAHQLERAKTAFEVGSATITDVNDAQARYDLTHAREIASANALEIARQSLAKLIGTYPVELTPLQGSLPMQRPEPQSITSWTEAAAKSNYQVLIAESGFGIAEREIKRVKGQAYPSVDVTASYNRNHANDSAYGVGINSNDANVALQLNVPLYAGGGVRAAVKQVRAQRDRAQYQLEEARRQAELAAQQSFLSVTNGILRIMALEQAERSSQGALDSTRRGMEVGVRTSLDVLNAQQQLFSAKRDLAEARYTYLLNRLQLQAAVGQLGEQDIEATSALLQGKAAGG